MAVGSASDGERPYDYHHYHHDIFVDGFHCCGDESGCR